MYTRVKRPLFSFLPGWLLLSLLTACALGNPSTGPNQPLSHATLTPVITSTSQMPATSTSCPAPSTARAMVTGPLTLGSDPAIVYSYDSSEAGFLRRYDVTTGKTTEILKLPGTAILGGQVSSDGKWVLFSNGPMLQVVRIDGQGLQTLYCGQTGGDFQWSTNQKLIAFTSPSATGNTLNLLHVADGTIETAFVQPSGGQGMYLLRTWLDNTHLYLTKSDVDVPPDGLFVLDLNRGLNQTPDNLITLVKRDPGSFQDFDSSYDGTQVFIAHSGCVYECRGPGNIIVEPAFGGTARTIFNSTYSILQVRAVTAQLLLFRVNDTALPNQVNDLSHNGLWAIHVDGTSPVHLTTDSDHLFSYLNSDSQYPWSNVSRDGSMYAVEQQTNQNAGGSSALLYGSLNGGSPTTLADLVNGTPLSIVGWTSM